MTEFKKGDFVKRESTGRTYRVRGVSSYYLDGDGSVTVVDAEELVAVSEEYHARLHAAFKQAEIQKVVSLLAKTQRDVQRLEAELARVNSGTY